MTIIADVFPTLRTPKNVVRSMSKNFFFRGLLEKQHGKRVQTLLKSERQQLYHLYQSLWRQITYKKSLLVLGKVLRLFVNTLTADGKYSFLKRKTSTHSIQILLSPKEKSFSKFFAKRLKSSLNFENFQKKDDPHRRYISEITAFEKRG